MFASKESEGRIIRTEMKQGIREFEHWRISEDKNQHPWGQFQSDVRLKISMACKFDYKLHKISIWPCFVWFEFLWSVICFNLTVLHFAVKCKRDYNGTHSITYDPLASNFTHSYNTRYPKSLVANLKVFFLF